MDKEHIHVLMYYYSFKLTTYIKTNIIKQSTLILNRYDFDFTFYTRRTRFIPLKQ